MESHNLYYCSVFGCRNNTATSRNMKMYKFPRALIRRDQWVKLIGQPDILMDDQFSLDPRVCEKHFDDNMRVNNKLIPLAYPNINLPKRAYSNLASTSTVTPSSSKCIDLKIEPPSPEPNIKMEIDDVLGLEQEIADMESTTNFLIQKCKSEKKFCRSKFMDTYESWHNEFKAQYEGHMYYKKQRLHCLNLYCKAPKAYPIFKKTFSLPSMKRLKATKINLPPGINENFIKLVGKQLENIPKSKHIIICLEEISIDKHLYYDLRHDNMVGFQEVEEAKKPFEIADKAFVLSIKGCCVNYQQMIGYCFVKSTFPYLDNIISRWLDNTIRIIIMAGLKVCAVVSKHTKILESVAKSKGVTPDDPCFKVDDKTIYYIFDLTQMINGVRDSLMSFDFFFEQKVASWDHLEIFYQIEKDRRIRLAPKLTKRHLKPTLAIKTQLQFSKDIFSDTVVAVMSADIDSELLPPEAQGTIDFLMKMSDLVNICNSNRINNKNKYKRAYNGADFQIETLSNAVTMFKKIEIMLKTSEFYQTEKRNRFNGIILSINAILRMYQDCHLNGLKYLLTERLHLKSEKLINALIQHGKKRNFMTAIKVKRGFSALALSQLIKNSTLTNYKGNLDTFILADDNVNDFSLLEEYMPNAPGSNPLEVGTTDYRFELPVNDIFQNVSSYLLKKCYQVHKCAVFKEYLDKSNKLIAIGQKYRMLEIYKDMVRAPQDFVTYLYQIEKIFIHDYEKVMPKPNLGLDFLHLLQISNDLKPCPCFPTDYLKKLFLRIRIYNVVKFRNRRLKSTLKSNTAKK